MDAQNHTESWFYNSATLTHQLLPQTLYEAYASYIRTLSTPDASKLNTALLRFTVPGWNGPEAKGARLSTQEKQTAIRFLKTLPFEKLWSAEKVMHSYLLRINTAKKDRRTPRYNLRKFVRWASDQGWGKPIQEGSALVERRVRFNNPDGFQRPTPSQVRTSMGYGKPKAAPMNLKPNEVNTVLEAQLQQWNQWMIENDMGERTRQNSRKTILRVLGWIHRNDGIPLESLRLETIVPYIKTAYNLTEFETQPDPFSAWVLTRERAIVEQQRAADTTVERLKGYLSSTKTCARAKMQYFMVVIRLAKYTYEKDTEFPNGRDSYRDISFIRQLRRYQAQLQRQAESKGPVVPFSAKSIPLEEVPKILEIMKAKTDQRTFHGVKRRQTAGAKSMQRLLMVLFFVVCPPRRVGAIANLVPGRSLVKGLVRKDGRFVPESQLGSNESAVWVIRLGTNKKASYKTVKRYGAVDIELVDYKFSDGTSFYTYIDLWLVEYRQMLDPQTNTSFVRDLTKGPMTSNAMTCKFRSQMNTIVGYPISPKEFRKMFVTYVKSRSATTERDMDGAAAALGHSRKMFDSVYDEEETNRKIQAGVELNRRIWKEISHSS